MNDPQHQEVNTSETASETASERSGEAEAMRKHVGAVDSGRTGSLKASRRPLTVPDIKGRDLL